MNNDNINSKIIYYNLMIKQTSITRDSPLMPKDSTRFTFLRPLAANLIQDSHQILLSQMPPTKRRKLALRVPDASLTDVSRCDWSSIAHALVI